MRSGMALGYEESKTRVCLRGQGQIKEDLKELKQFSVHRVYYAQDMPCF